MNWFGGFLVYCISIYLSIYLCTVTICLSVYLPVCLSSIPRSSGLIKGTSCLVFQAFIKPIKKKIGCTLYSGELQITPCVAVNNAVTPVGDMTTGKIPHFLSETDVGKTQTQKSCFLLKPRNLCNIYKHFFFSHGMLQDADSNAKHVMSSTKLMQSQQTPCSSPSPLNGWVSAAGMKSHTARIQVTNKAMPHTVHLHIHTHPAKSQVAAWTGKHRYYC